LPEAIAEILVAELNSSQRDRGGEGI